MAFIPPADDSMQWSQPAECQYQMVPVVPVLVWCQPMLVPVQQSTLTGTPYQPPPARKKQQCEQAQQQRKQAPHLREKPQQLREQPQELRVQQPGLALCQRLQRMCKKHKATKPENRHTTGKGSGGF
eukprot:5865179-Amphidinium_carterae.1